MAYLAFRVHLFPSLFILVLSLALQLQIGRWVSEKRPDGRAGVRAAQSASAVLLLLGYFFEFQRVAWFLPGFAGWMQSLSMFWSISLIGIFVGMLVWRHAGESRPERRHFL